MVKSVRNLGETYAKTAYSASRSSCKALV